MHHDKRASTSSYADSGYFAPSVTSTAPSKTSPFNRTLQHTLAYYGPAAERSRASSVQSTRSRRTDEVIACPRPLAFPFHNDSYFLPVAETAHSTVSASKSTRSLVSLPKTESGRHKDPSIDSIPPGTVRSLKVFFQKTADSTEPLTASSANRTLPSKDPTSTVTSPPKSVFAGIKQGTVKALQRLFTPNTDHLEPPSPPKPRTWKWWKPTKVANQDAAKGESLKSRRTSTIYGDASTPLLQPPTPAAKKPGNRFFPKLSKPPWLSKSSIKPTDQFDKKPSPISNLWHGLKSFVKRKS